MMGASRRQTAEDFQKAMAFFKQANEELAEHELNKRELFCPSCGKHRVYTVDYQNLPNDNREAEYNNYCAACGIAFVVADMGNEL